MSAIVKTASVRVMLSAMESIFKGCGLPPETQWVLIHSASGKKSFDFSILAANGRFRYNMPCTRNTRGWDIQGAVVFGDLAHCMESFSGVSGNIEWSQENAPSFGDTICCRLRVHGQVSEHRFPCCYILLPIPEEKEFARKMTLPFRRNSLLPALEKLTAFLQESGVPLAEQRISVCSKSCGLSAMSPHEVLDLHLPEMTFNKGRLTFKLPSVAPFLKAVQATRSLQETAMEGPSRISILKKDGKPASYEFEVESCSWCWRGPVQAMRTSVWTKLHPTREQLRLQLDLSQRGETFYTDRTSRRNFDHRHSCGNAPAGFELRQKESKCHSLCRQPQTKHVFCHARQKEWVAICHEENRDNILSSYRSIGTAGLPFTPSKRPMPASSEVPTSCTESASSPSSKNTDSLGAPRPDQIRPLLQSHRNPHHSLANLHHSPP